MINTILLVEDDPAHARIIEKMLQRQKLTNPLIQFPTGKAVLDYLYGREAYAGRTLPEKLVMLLDLNLPGLTGFEVLDVLDRDGRLKTIPCIMISTSDQPSDMERFSLYHGIAYLVKPLDYEQLASMLRELDK